MFGYVNANWKELPKERQKRFGTVYCGVCRRIREQSGSFSRLSLQYDAAFLGMLLMSLDEPEETAGPNACKETRPAVCTPSASGPGWTIPASPMPRI